YDIQPFRIASGGPYDVFLDLVDNEVQPGTPLGFDITIWNKGEIDHVDVVANYWVTGQGQSWDSSSFSTNILGGENKTFRRSAFIYSNQPPGIYTLNAEVIYDPNQPPATANTTFLVSGAVRPDEGGGGEGAPPPGPPGPTGHINITDVPDQVGAMVGLPKLFSIEVTAVDGPLSNIWLEFRGMPADWIDVMEPANITSLGTGQNAVITVQITVPRGESGERNVKVIAHSTESTDEREFTLRIFTSRQDLINFELARLRAKLAELRDRSDSAAQAGFDTSKVDDLLDDAESEIRMAESYLRDELYDAALRSIYTAWKHLDDAEDLLDKMVAGFAIPWWLLLIIAFAFIIVGVFFLYRKMSRKLSILVRGRMSEARQVAGAVKGSGMGIDNMRKEKAKTQRMMILLESQSKQGIISKEAYESLRKRSEQRMAEFDKKIREAIKG
ncbi:MAG: hypothetical protein KAT35_02065, partial [Candidatus Aenigmarchaeota archaeon]|nr:hypothetical protein [Candidatus Aenigmarchaeota archaeon]